jgi:phenylpyruvate tautomerase PptA (4-oxalocrotonate tautomerase family)
VPIIIVKTVKDAVLTSDEQKRELLKKMTDTFIEVVGEVARPFTYCIIEETPMYEWSLAGVPLPDFKYLTSPEWKGLQAKSEQIMLDYMAFLASQASGNGAQDQDKARKAEDVFGS